MSSVEALIYFAVSFLVANVILLFNKEELKRTQMENLNESSMTPLNLKSTNNYKGFLDKLCFKF